MDFEVQILGSNSALAAHGRHPSAQLVRHGQQVFLVDCGEATQLQLQKYKCKPFRIQHIFISHLHGDHYFGLIGLITTYHLLQRKTPLTIYGPKPLEAIIRLQLEVANTQLNYPLIFKATQDQVKELIYEDEHLMVYTFPLRHRIPTTGFLFREKKKHPRKIDAEKTSGLGLSPEDYDRLRKGLDITDSSGNIIPNASLTLPGQRERSYAYCSDTLFFPELAEEIRQVSLLYHEGTFLDECAERAAETFHSTCRQAAEIARLSGAERLLIGHFSSKYMDLKPLLNEARSTFPNTYLAQEGKTFSIQ